MLDKIIETPLGGDLHFPLNKINDPNNEELMKESILKFLGLGYQRLRSHYSPPELSGNEPSISQKLKRSLVSLETLCIVNTEPSSDNDGREGRNDLKIQLSGWKKYFVFECKRVDGGPGYSRKYITKGLIRFCNGKYCVDFDGTVINPERSPNFAGMIAYVIGGEMESIVDDIKGRVRNASFNENGTDFGKMSMDSEHLLLETVPPFEYGFKSRHERVVITSSTIIKDIDDVLIYHIFFDLA